MLRRRRDPVLETEHDERLIILSWTTHFRKTSSGRLYSSMFGSGMDTAGRLCEPCSTTDFDPKSGAGPSSTAPLGAMKSESTRRLLLQGHDTDSVNHNASDEEDDMKDIAAKAMDSVSVVSSDAGSTHQDEGFVDQFTDLATVTLPSHQQLPHKGSATSSILKSGRNSTGSASVGFQRRLSFAASVDELGGAASSNLNNKDEDELQLHRRDSKASKLKDQLEKQAAAVLSARKLSSHSAKKSAKVAPVGAPDQTQPSASDRDGGVSEASSNASRSTMATFHKALSVDRQAEAPALQLLRRVLAVVCLAGFVLSVATVVYSDEAIAVEIEATESVSLSGDRAVAQQVLRVPW